MSTPPGHDKRLRLYDGEIDSLMAAELAPERVTLLPGHGSQPGNANTLSSSGRIRILWGQDLLRDVLDGRYRVIVCGVNDADNSHGVVTQIVELVRTSQWTAKAVTSYAKMFQESVGIHAYRDREPYVLKIDLDSILILGLLRPRGKDHFTLDDLERGFSTVAKMTAGRHDRSPIASVSFLNARANRLVDEHGREPSFEATLRAMYNGGFRGDVYTAPMMWKLGHVGVFPSYPFPEGVTRMREGSS
jgi:hypothetical protein